MKRHFLFLVAMVVTLCVAPTYALDFAPNDLWNIGAGPGYLLTSDADSSKIAYEARASIPAFGLLKFLGKVPGFAFELGLGYDYGLFFQVAPSIRMKVLDKLYLKAGVGMGYNFEQSLYAPLLAGVDIYITDYVGFNISYCKLLAAAATIENSSRIIGSVSISGRYEN